ncbi:MAG TPA: methyltransferase domain-containing protein [Chroococcales cyanobacterium]
MRADVIANFSNAATVYDDHAHVQRDTALSLISYANDRRVKLPPGEILEIGCGTGIFSQHLVSRFPERALTISDASVQMLDQCRRRMHLVHPLVTGGSSSAIKFQVVDADDFAAAEKYALIASSFALHWLTDLKASLERLLDALVPGGVMLFAVPAAGSFPEWQEMAQRLKVPFSANQLPDADLFARVAKENGVTFHAKQEELRYTYPSALFFFKSMKLLGAGATTDDERRLSQARLRRLLRVWGADDAGRVQVTYRIIYGEIKKPHEPKR